MPGRSSFSSFIPVVGEWYSVDPFNVSNLFYMSNVNSIY